MIAYILRSLLRNKTRSLLTIGAVALTTFIFCFVRAIDSGMDRLLASSGAEKKWPRRPLEDPTRRTR